MSIVFQYGSNCDIQRLNSAGRLGGAATPIGKAQTVEDFEITFDVWSIRNNCAAADLVRSRNTKAWGILYEIPDDRIDGPTRSVGRKTLAQIEGPSYEKKLIEVKAEGETHWAITFVVKEKERISGKATSAKYVSHIVKGLRDHGVSEEYVNQVIDAAVASIVSAGLENDVERMAIEELRKPGRG